MRSGYILDNLASADIQEIVETGGVTIQIYQNVIHRENFKVNPVQNVIKKYFSSRLKYTEVHDEVMILLVISINNKSLHGEQISKDFGKEYSCKSK